MQRIVIIGTSGSGKSTLGQQLAYCLDYPHIELDSLYWQPNWQGAEKSVFQQRVTQALQAPKWVVDGNYSKVRDVIWKMADTLIWLDYPFWLTFWRVLRRTFKRLTTQEELWGTGNRENWRTTLSKDSIIWWMITTHRKRKAEYPPLLAQPEYAHLDVLHFTSPRQTENWLKGLQLKSSSQEQGS